MTKKTLEAHEYSLKGVFCDDYSFEIPGYQRPYSWEVEQAETLVDDLLQFLAEQPKNIKEASPYFLGSIVLIKPDGALSQVVDGQQRLTTLTILLSVIRSLVSSKYSAGLENAIFQKGDPILLTEDKPRLKTRPKDQQFFLKYLQEAGGLADLFATNITMNDSQKNMRKNAMAMHSQLKGLEEEALIRLTQFLMLGCFVVLVTTPDVDSAYRIFSVMNDRGLDLSATDILKSLITGAIPESNDKQSFYTNKWEDLEENIGRDRFNALFSHIRMIELRAKSRSNMVSDFKAHIKPEQDSISFIDNKLAPYTQIYSEILDQNFSSHSFEAEINRSLFWLRRIDNSDWVPAAIYYMAKYRSEPERLAIFLDSLEKLTSVLMINRISINYRIARYTDILNAIDSDNEFSADSKLFLTVDEKQDAIKQLSGPIYKLSKIRVMVLLRLDSELSDNMAQYNHSKITVEHVMPQNPTMDSLWKQWCPSDEEHQELVHCLGNLALLSRNKNSAASNYEFDKKKTAYFNPVNGHTSFVLTNQIIKELDWKPKLIRERQSMLVEKLILAWDLRSESLQDVVNG
ncbi:DUF262 domain-containing protein [Colwellia sp. PAMC 21821]|uniref:DUF262 domain-containing protein n=1 Tax=Colwellia sp. PAMC 21821 TaxID=1816219 RepID=UPI0009BD6E91|nr:DUF262 domain-containing protein [Colwellia sp. PAMC 21821]ARD44451.1 hypothetical protein A3Q33_09110 [Colwellia sp. PAMC 21821]